MKKPLIALFSIGLVFASTVARADNDRGVSEGDAKLVSTLDRHRLRILGMPSTQIFNQLDAHVQKTGNFTEIEGVRYESGIKTGKHIACRVLLDPLNPAKAATLTGGFEKATNLCILEISKNGEVIHHAQ